MNNSTCYSTFEYLYQEQKYNLNNVLLLLLGLWPKNDGFDIPKHYFGPLYHACTTIFNYKYHMMPEC